MTPIRLLAGCVAAALAFTAVASAMAQSPLTRLARLDRRQRRQDRDHCHARGHQVPVKLADNYAVMLVMPVTLADVKENSFVGIASMKAPDGS